MLAQKVFNKLKVLLMIYFKNITKHFYRLATKNWWLSDIKTLNLSHIYKLAARQSDNNNDDTNNNSFNPDLCN